MSSMTGGSMGGGGLKLKLKIKMPGAPAAASCEPAPAPAPAPPAAAAPSAYMRPPPPQRQPLQTSASGRLRRAASAGVALLTAAEGGTPASPGHYQQQYMQQQQEAMGAGRMQRQRSKRQMGDEYVGVDELDDYIKEQRIEAEDLTEDGEAAAARPTRAARGSTPAKRKRTSQIVLDDDDDDADSDAALQDDPNDSDVDITALDLEDDADDIDFELDAAEDSDGGFGRRKSNRARRVAAPAAAASRPQRSKRKAAAAAPAMLPAAEPAAAAAAVAAYAATPAYAAAPTAASAPAPAAAAVPQAQASVPVPEASGGKGSAFAAAAAKESSVSKGGSRGAAKRSVSKGAGGVGAAVGGRSARPRRAPAAFAEGSFVTGDLSDEDVDDDEEEVFNQGAFGDSQCGDFSALSLKTDHCNRPMWVTPDGRIFLETYSPIYKQAYDFLIAIAEPVCRPECVHEYMLTPHSLYAAVSVGLETETIISVLNRLSKVSLPPVIERFIRQATQNYGKAKLVLKRNKFWVESSHPDVLNKLLADPVIRGARADVSDDEGDGGSGKGGKKGGVGGFGRGVVRSKALKEHAAAALVDTVQQLAQEAAQDGEVKDAKPSMDGAMSAGAKAEAKQPGASYGGGYGPDGMSESESDPEDYHGTSKRGRFAAAAGPGPGSAAAQAAAGAGPKGRGVGPIQGGTDVGEGPSGVLDMEVEEDPTKEVLAFEIKASEVEVVKKQCLPPPEGRLNFPLLEEYDFRNDTANPNLNIELKPHVALRPYQEKSLAKMFGNGRARSGIIVLPCGAGKSLVGVAAAARVRKSILCLCTSSVSVDQWKHQFMLWTNLQDHQITRFTSNSREEITGLANVTITTFTMISHGGKRSEHGEKAMNDIKSREWGLLLLDEVHVVPAQMFRKVIGIVHAHCKLGLTATLVREDERIGDLNFLIGPKLYEANWLDLTRAGHIANVSCAEVWCPMTKEFFQEYLKEDNAPKRQLLYCMNPNKFMACQFLVWFHEVVRGDKVIVFSDNIFALREYAIRMNKPFIYGPTSHNERTRVLHAFKHNPNVNTVFLSKVGDNSLDIPEANVLIQISSHAGSRRQEAQRLGRILRAKRGKPGSGAEDEFNAFFYTLVSRDTQEMYYSAKRQQFLIDQGYSFKVVTNLLDSARGEQDLQLHYSTKDEQLTLLARVLAADVADSGVEALEDDDPEDLVTHQNAGGRPARRREGGNMALLSGGAGYTYLEYSKAGGGGRGRGRGSQKVAGERAVAYKKRLLK